MNAIQLARIKKMEDDFNLVSEVVKSLDEALADYEAIQRRINRLTDYQESGQWLDPLVDNPEAIPEAPGSLIFVLRYMSNLHQLAGMNLKEFEGQGVIFVGESENLLVYYKATPYHAQLTRLMISAFNPPLNLDNTSPDRQEFRKELTELRSKH